MSADTGKDQEHQDIPSEFQDHLDLVKDDKNLNRKKREGPTYYFGVKDRDKREFARVRTKQLETLKTQYQAQKTELGRHHDPELLFTIKTHPDKDFLENIFAKDLKEVQVDIVSSAESKSGKWVVHPKDEKLEKLETALKEYNKAPSTTFLDIVESFDEISKEEKESLSIKENPITGDEPVTIDVELEKLTNDYEQREVAVENFKEFIKSENGIVKDSFITDHLARVKVTVVPLLYEKILKRGQVTSVSRTAKPEIEIPDYNGELKKQYEKECEEFNGKEDKEFLNEPPPPSEDVPSVLVLDSGVVHHPLLRNSLSLVDEEPTSDEIRIRADQPFDDVGHGTAMAGIVLYGDLEKCRKNKSFIPEIRINSSKIMFRYSEGDARFDQKDLLERQLKNAIEKIVAVDKKCRVVNMSIGDGGGFSHGITKQLPIAALIDEIAFKKRKLMFVVSTGNNSVDSITDYPNYLLHETTKTKIIDPATSAHALTVASIRNHSDHPGNAGNWPSSGTRIGLGFKDMIKPELTVFGGDQHDDVTCLQWQFHKYGPFVGDYGTSMSAALISHYLAKLTAKFIDEDRNLLKAYLISSSEIPPRPPQINDIQKDCGVDVIKENLRVYGYGKPNLEHALYSGGNHVLLKNSSSIGLNKVDFFQFWLPNEFFRTRGTRKISVTLVYDPPTNKRKSVYMGVKLDYRLFKNATLEKIQKEYGTPAEIVNPEYEAPKLDRNNIELVPGPSLRDNSTHQHSFIEYKNSPRFQKDLPLVLAVRCRNIWEENLDHLQPYGVVVKLSHSAEIDLYETVRNINRIKLQERLRGNVQG